MPPPDIFWRPSAAESASATFWALRILRSKQVLEHALTRVRPAGAPLRMPHAVAHGAGYADAAISRLLGREPRIPLEGVRMARHSMFVNTGKGAPRTGIFSRPGGCRV